jgi:hypothetical protein
MATKQTAYAALGDPWQDGTDVPDCLVTIQGLRHEPNAGEFAFSLEGVKGRQINWLAMAEVLGFPTMPDQLADDLHEVIWKYDLVRILSERIKLA